MDTPARARLVEPGTSESLRKALRECRERRHAVVSFAVNVGLVLGLVFLLWTILTYRQRHRIDPEVRERQAQIAQGNLFAMLGRHDRRMNNVTTW